MRDNILVGEELEKLTGCKRATAQVRALNQMGIPHRIRPDGWPVVAESDLVSNKPRTAQPDFDAIG